MEKIFIMWNAFVFFLYGFDKNQAKKKKRRISEKGLIYCTAFMGAPGAFLGMVVFRHKTKKTKFKLLVPLFLILEIIIIGYVYESVMKRS